MKKESTQQSAGSATASDATPSQITDATEATAIIRGLQDAKAGRVRSLSEIDAEPAGSASVAVCVAESYFPDDIKGVCDHCQTPIVWRPHNPGRTHICLACAFKLFRQDEIEMIVTKESTQEIQQILRPKGMA